MGKLLGYILLGILCFSCTSSDRFNVDTALSYCVNQVDSTLHSLEAYDAMPRNIQNDYPHDVRL